MNGPGRRNNCLTELTGFRRASPLSPVTGDKFRRAFEECVCRVGKSCVYPFSFLIWQRTCFFFPFKHFTRTEKTIRNLNGDVIRKYADGDGVVCIFLAAGKVEP